MKIEKNLPTPPSHSLAHSRLLLATEEFLQVLLIYNPTTCPLDPIPSTMLWTISQGLFPNHHYSTIVNGSKTSGHAPTAFREQGLFPASRNPLWTPQTFATYWLTSLFSSTISLCISHRTTSKIQTSLASKQYISQNLSFCQRSSIRLGQPNCHQASSSLGF